MYDGATYFAWFVLALLFLLAVAFVVWIGSLPKKIAEKRNNPQVDAINALSWFGLLLGGVGWVVAFVWALYRPGGAASSGQAGSEQVEQLLKSNQDLCTRMAKLEGQLSTLQSAEK